ncbi:MAG: DNA repair protein RadA, partial [Phototrophicales bacterium]
MAKSRTQYVCTNCGKRSPGFLGRCPQCGEFNTMQEEVLEASKSAPVKQNRQPAGTLRAEPQRLHEVQAQVEDRYRVPVEEFNRVMGGGVVPGSISLIGGDPGIGKSTLLLEVSALLANSLGHVLY